jgi:tetratricopeptide (TPR) repeat protein
MRMIIECVREFIENPPELCRELEGRLKEKHKDWTAAADLVLDAMHSGELATSHKIRKVAMAVVARGHGEEASAAVVRSLVRGVREGNKESRRRALEWLRAALSTNVGREHAMIGIAHALTSTDRVMRDEAADAISLGLGSCKDVSKVLPMLVSSLGEVDASGKDGAIARAVLAGVESAARHGHAITPLRAKLEALAARSKSVGDVAARALLYHAVHHQPKNALTTSAHLDVITVQDLVSCIDHAAKPARGAMARRMLPFYLSALAEGEPPVRAKAAEAMGVLFLTGADPADAWEPLGVALRDSSKSGPKASVGSAAAWAIARLGNTAPYRNEALKVLSAALLERSAPVRERAATATFLIHVAYEEFDAARALLTHSDASHRIGALHGLEACVARGEAVAPLRGDIELIEEAEFHDATSGRTTRSREGEMARELLERWGTPDDLLRTARTVLRRASELAVEDDSAVLTRTRRIVENGLRIEGDHLDLLDLLGELWIRSRDMKQAQQVFARLVELEPDNPKHGQKLVILVRAIR